MSTNFFRYLFFLWVVFGKVLLSIDEVLDHGHIVELDVASIVSRVLMRGSHGDGESMDDLSISQALGMASVQLIKSIGAREG